MTMETFESEIVAYKEACELTDEQFEGLKSNNVDMIVRAFIAFDDSVLTKHYGDYVALFLKNLIRFIDGNIRIDRVSKVQNDSFDHMVRQTITGEENIFTGLACDEKTFLSLAGRYADEKFKAVEEYPIDAAGEFLNLHNGLFTVNMSNEGVEMTIDIQSYIDAPTLNPSKDLYKVPVYTSIGTINIIIGQLY